MKRIRQKSLGLLCAACLMDAAPSVLSQENWPRFRGARADGVAREDSRLPEVWDKSTNVKWSAEVPGWGWSSPVVWGDQVFLTSVVSEAENIHPQKGLYRGEGVRDPAKGVHHWMVYCFDRYTGAMRWKREAHTGNPKVPRHPKNTYAAETPTTDGQRLYVLFGDLGLYCYDLDGQPVWSHPIEPKKTFMDYGAAASPVVHEGQVFVVYDNLEASWIAAFDAATGQIRWQQRRDEERSWATPFVWDNELRTEIVVPGKNRNRSYSLTGERLWEFDGDMSNLVIPSPFAAQGLCYIASGYVGDAHRPTFAIKPGAKGDITPKAGGDYTDSPYIEWYQPKASPYNTTQIVYRDHLYTVHDQGFLTCHNARTGELVYGKKRFQPAASFTASPWAYNGYLFCLSEDGQTYVLKAGPEFEIVRVNDLDELCLATPAIADGRLLVRTASRLYCISGGARAKDVAHAGSTDVQPAQPSDIWAATREGNRNALIHDLDEGASGNARDPQEGSTPLNTAVLFGQTEIVKLLLDRVSLSPGETRVCFEYQRGYEYKDAGRTLYLADFDAKKPSITNARAFANAEGANRWFAHPRWTKDEAAIVYHASPSLSLYTLKDGTTRKVSTNPRAEYRYPHTAGAPK